MATYTIKHSTFAVVTTGLMSSTGTGTGADVTGFSGDGNGVLCTIGSGTGQLGNTCVYMAKLISPAGKVLARATGSSRGEGFQEATIIVLDNAALAPGILEGPGTFNPDEVSEQTYFNIYNHPAFTPGAKARLEASCSGKVVQNGVGMGTDVSTAQLSGNGHADAVLTFWKE